MLNLKYFSVCMFVVIVFFQPFLKRVVLQSKIMSTLRNAPTSFQDQEHGQAQVHLWGRGVKLFKCIFREIPFL